MKPKLWLTVLAMVLALAGSHASAAAQSPQPAPAAGADDSPDATPTAPVIVDGDDLFRVRGVSAYPATRRAADIADRIEAVAADRSVPADSLRLVELERGTQILAGSRPLMVVGDADAAVDGVSRSALATVTVARIREAIDAYRHRRQPDVLERAALDALLATLAVVAGLLAGRWIYRRIRARIERVYRERVHDVEIRSFKLITAERLWRILGALVSLAWVILALAAIYSYLHYVLLQFPWTRALGLEMRPMVETPLTVIGGGAIAIVPNLVFLLILVLVTRYLLKVIRLFFVGVGAGTVVLPSFDPEWALPTYRLVRLLVIAFAIIVAYPYVPGSETEAFKGVSLFIGVVFSLGSSSFIGNLIAGYSMTYRRAFHVGDRVKIGDHLGDVEAIRLMVTHLRTPKNEEVIVPNSEILGGEVINYSTLARQTGLILHTTVGIGYETPWRQVEAMLLEAAGRTEGLLKQPPPFILQKELGTFSVTYELNVYCATPRLMGPLYAALHRSILDVFNEYGVQIMTPAYEGDPERPKLVEKPDWYRAPADSSPAGGDDPNRPVTPGDWESGAKA